MFFKIEYLKNRLSVWADFFACYENSWKKQGKYEILWYCPQNCQEGPKSGQKGGQNKTLQLFQTLTNIKSVSTGNDFKCLLLCSSSYLLVYKWSEKPWSSWNLAKNGRKIGKIWEIGFWLFDQNWLIRFGCKWM